jgi:hypothetical protein
MTESKVGLANPYALAEVALGRRVNWKTIADHEGFVKKTLGASIEELCAPAPGNLMVSGAADSQEILTEIRSKKAAPSAQLVTRVKAGPVSKMLTKLPEVAKARVSEALAGGQNGGPGYTPAGAEWADPGEFFEEGAEFFDPTQGGLGDCYFISALCAVAWARPDVILHHERTIGPGQEQFVDCVDFYANGAKKTIEVSELMPVLKTTHAWIYGRSSEPGEIWPAVYEKAFAKWKTNDPGDQPNYGPIAGGWPVQALVELTNLKGVTKTCSDFTADAIWQLVRSNCLSMRTVNPMTAWTFCATPTPVDYNGTGIYAYHAYTLLGWAFVNNIKYVVLRNPWGQNGPVINALAGAWSALESHNWWRSIQLNSGGVFAIPVDTFKKYYWQFGWVS